MEKIICTMCEEVEATYVIGGWRDENAIRIDCLTSELTFFMEEVGKEEEEEEREFSYKKIKKEKV